MRISICHKTLINSIFEMCPNTNFGLVFEGIFRFSEFKMLHTQFYLILKRIFKACNLISLKLHENQMGINGIIQHTETRSNGLRNSSAHKLDCDLLVENVRDQSNWNVREEFMFNTNALNPKKPTSRICTMKMLSFQMNCSDRYFLKFCFH